MDVPSPFISMLTAPSPTKLGSGMNLKNTLVNPIGTMIQAEIEALLFGNGNGVDIVDDDDDNQVNDNETEPGIGGNDGTEDITEITIGKM